MKVIYKILLVISFLPILFFLIGLLYSVYAGFFSNTSLIFSSGGGNAVEFIRLGEGWSTVYDYIYFMIGLNTFGIINIPIYIVGLLYQMVYLKKLKK